MLRDFINQYQENRITATKPDKSPTSKFRSFINSFLIDMLVFIVVILTAFISICDNLHHHMAVKTKSISGYYGLTESKNYRCP